MGNHYHNDGNANPQEDMWPNRVRKGFFLEKNVAFSAVYHSVLGIIGWPFSFFTLSAEDRLKAGIDMGNEVGEVELADRKDYQDEKIQIQ
jgi:hypothetical protein